VIDVVLLRLMRRRSDHFKLKDLYDPAALDPRANALIEDFTRYFELYPSHDIVDPETFIPHFKRWHPKMKDDVWNVMKGMIRNSLPEPDEEQAENILAELSEIRMMTKLANLADQHQQGDLSDAFAQIQQAFDEHRQRLGVKAAEYIDIPIAELMQDEFDDVGIEWRLLCLRDSMRGLRPGDFGIIAGRPDKGKTSFIASEVTHMAPQLPEDKNVVWLNNEGPGKRIITRLYQAALNLSMNEMKEMQAANDRALVDNYRTQVGGRLDKIRVLDVHGMNTGQVESLIDRNNAGLIVYDMIDNIRGFGDQPRTDLVLEKMYQWAREISVKYECVGLATSQISAEGDGLQFPTLSMLKDSKTGKQGACDFQLMIGASNDIGLAGSRFIGLPKNKLRRADAPGDPRAEVIFDGIRSRYRDITTGS
jgi:replicative DNA helicase